MDIPRLEAVQLRDPDGAVHRLGDLWEARPVVLVFLRHFGWLHCRHHVAQLRDDYQAITARGAEIVAVGTGDASYARSFVADTGVGFPVLVDDSGAAAEAVSVRRSGLLTLVGPGAWANGRQVWRAGHHVHRPGKRVTQLGATVVIGPGPHLRYEHLDAEPWDHAPLEEVLRALGD